ncbi:MAG: S8 family serine peptidase [Sphingomonadales bacterium]|nr:S8 family serine peptidase [Sphingomonadales bacterium]
MTAWNLGDTGTGVTIGIVDTGIDVSNSEFAGRIAAASRDVVASRGLVNADSDHGTNVALVAAAARNGSGMVGIANTATIAMFRADTVGTCATADPAKPDSGCSFDDNAIATGVNEAVAAGAKVINLSLGGSSPASILTNAIATAAANGVVVIVSAGNDGASTDPTKNPNNPDPFAAGLRAAGNGNVIIAGSVDVNNVISSFSNRAGTEANSYLAARGEDVCCVYENGVMKVVTNPDGSRSVYVFSGTSFSAPQIAGAAALLIQAFPNLTATQVVNLLLRTATDAGASGTDAIYGRGILNIAAAFAPQGTTSLAGSTVAIPLGGTTIATSAAMGDAGTAGTGLSTIVLDSYGRAYRYDLASGLRSGRSPARLAPALSGSLRNMTLGSDNLSMAFTVDAQQRAARLPWQGGLRLSFADGEAARVLAGRVVARIAPHSQIAFGFSQGPDGLVAQLQGQSRPAFFIAHAPDDDLGFAHSDNLSIAWRQSLGAFGLTTSVARGEVYNGLLPTGFVIAPGQQYAGIARVGVALDRDFGSWRLAAGANWLTEQHSVLGARFAEGLIGGGADSLFADAGAQWSFAPSWRLGGNWRGGYTAARTGGLNAGGTRLFSTAWSLDLAREGLFQQTDSLALRMSQPLRVESGGLRVNLPVDYSYATLQSRWQTGTLSLSPTGREIDGELAWRGDFVGGTAGASLFYRRNPGHIASLPSDAGAALSWNRKF